MDSTKKLIIEIEDLKREISNIERVLENSPDVFEKKGKKNAKLTAKNK